MLKTMREGSAIFVKGVMIVVVVTFVGTIFVVWGVKSLPGELGRRGIAAVVGNVEIPLDEYREAYRRQVETYKQLFKDKLDEKLLESLNLKQQVLDRLIRRAPDPAVRGAGEHHGRAGRAGGRDPADPRFWREGRVQ